jgi:ubiquinone/menaquinone biosynthesis methyltransferase
VRLVLYSRILISDPDFQPENVKELFNRMSGSYERMNYITSFGFSLRWRKQFVQILPATNEKIRVIDLMTGMGETWHPVKAHYPMCEFSALDFSEGMLKSARQKNKKEFDDGIHILQKDILASDLPSDHYDIVLSAFGMKTFNAEQLSVLANEIKRILKPGGKFSLIEVSAPRNPVMRTLYKLHLKYIVPACGWLFLGNPSEYKMLWKYTEKFKNSKDAEVIFRNAGLIVEPVTYFFGCATGIRGARR